MVKSENDIVLSIIRNISARKFAKEELRDSEKRFRSISENAPFGISIYQHDKWVFVNPAVKKISGYSMEELVKMNFWEIVHEDFREMARKLGKKRQIGEELKKSHDVKIITKDQQEKWVHLKAGNVVWKGEPAVIITILDINDRKNLEEELIEYRHNLENLVKGRTKELKEKSDNLERSEKALTYLMEDTNESKKKLEAVNEELKEANKEMESFSYSVSHDLLAPLRHISGFADMLKKSDETNFTDKGLRFLNIIIDSANNMGKLIDGLLMFSRLGRKHPQKSKVDLDEQIKNTVEEFKDVSSEKTINWKINKNLGTVRRAATLLRQVWINLISNAIKYSAKEENPEIKIDYMKDEDGKKVYYVKDNGVGFNQKYQQQMFGVFQRLHTKEDFKGIGIGLANVKKIISKHGGKIWAEGKEGEGATFYFNIQN